MTNNNPKPYMTPVSEKRMDLCLQFCAGFNEEALKHMHSLDKVIREREGLIGENTRLRTVTNNSKPKVQGLGAVIHTIELRDIFAGLIAVGFTANPESEWIDSVPSRIYSAADKLLEAREATRTK